MTKKYEVFVKGNLTYTFEDRSKAEAMGRFLLEQNPNSAISIREWVSGGREVLL